MFLVNYLQTKLTKMSLVWTMAIVLLITLFINLFIFLFSPSTHLLSIYPLNFCKYFYVPDPL